MPAFSLFPEAGNSGLAPFRAPRLETPPRPDNPNDYIESFKEVLESVRKWKQGELDKLEEKTMAILNTMAQPISEDVEAMERLEGDLEAISERHRRLGKIYGTYDDQAGKWVLDRVMDEETKTWSTEEWQSLMADLEVHDGFISGRKSEESGDPASKTGKPPKKKRNQGKARGGSKGRKRRMEIAQMLDADSLHVGQATRQTNTSAGNGANDGDEDIAHATDSEPGVASSNARRQAKKTKADIPKAAIEVRRKTPKVPSQGVKPQQATEEPLAPNSWRAPGAWTKTVTYGTNLEETEEDVLPNNGLSERPASPQASAASSESSDNLFVGPHKEKRAHTGYFRPSAPSPPPRSIPGSAASAGSMRALFERTSDSMAMPETEPGSAGSEAGAEDRLRREAAALAAPPNTREILLLEEQALGSPLPSKRAVDAEVAGALGAFTSTKPPKKKAKKGGEEGEGGEKSSAPVRWPGQARRK